MTIGELYSHGKEILKQSEISSYSFECAVLIEKFFGYTRNDIITKGENLADSEKERLFLSALKKRSENYPLQYIIGSWPFMSLELEIGQGVLIPREDTEILVRCAHMLINETKNAHGVDLCAGSGAVGLGLLSLKEDLEIVLIELSNLAYPYLERNIERYGNGKVKTLKANITDKEFASRFHDLDFIVSNPPYIESSELKKLQKEVQLEPKMALDGGNDGLYYYRKIAEIWTPCLSVGGIIALEIGDTQGAEVKLILEQSGFSNVEIHKDLAGLDRCVTGKLKG